MSRRHLLYGNTRVPDLSEPIEEPEEPGDGGGPVSPTDPKITMDWSQVSDVGFGNQSGIRNRWDNLPTNPQGKLLGDYIDAFYSANTDISKVGDYLRVRHDGGIPGVRLGQGAERLNLGRHGWASWEFLFESSWPTNTDLGAKTPGLCGGYDFPSGGTNAYYNNGETDVNWKGWSCRINSWGRGFGAYAYHYQPDRINDPNPDRSGPIQGGEHWTCVKNGINPEADIASGTGTHTKWSGGKIQNLWIGNTGQWYRMTQHIIMNTGANNYDGGLEIFIDGILRCKRTGVRWVGPNHYQSVKDPSFDPAKGVDGFYFSNFFNSPPSPTPYMRFRDFFIGSTADSVGHVFVANAKDL